jgi:hypothetical protein
MAVPPAAILEFDTVIVDFDVLAAAGTTVTVGGVELTFPPPMVAVIVLLPALVPVKVTV